MRKKKTDCFTCFCFFLITLIIFFFLRLTYGMQEEKQQYTALVSLQGLSYDQDFLKNASKIKGMQQIWPVVEIPVTIRIDDYTKNTVFNGINLNAFTQISDDHTIFGSTPLLLLGNNALENMKDSNGHIISKKQQQKYLQMGENLEIIYTLTDASDPVFLPCKVAAILPWDDDQIYIPFSQAGNLNFETGSGLNVTKVFLKVKGKSNLEKAKHLIGG